MPGVETALVYDLGTDQQYAFTVYTTSDEDRSVIREVTGFALSFMVKRSLGDADANALLTKTGPSDVAISGAFNADPDTNTQRVTVTLADTDLQQAAIQNGGRAYWELKRVDAGSESRLAFGEMELRRTVHRS